jgi:hypothetical protein
MVCRQLLFGSVVPLTNSRATGRPLKHDAESGGARLIFNAGVGPF